MATKVQKDVAKKLVKANNRRITRANKIFEKMTPAEKRVQIARDVLAQLASKRLKAEPGVWLSGINNKNLFNKTDIKQDAELKEILSKTKQCEGCALGGMFMCAVERANKLKVSQLESGKEYVKQSITGNRLFRNRHVEGTISEDDALSYMKKFFSNSQLEMIESAFEQGGGVMYHSGAIEFANDVEDPQTRMRLIMENIIVNNGTFKPSKHPVSITNWITTGYQV